MKFKGQTGEFYCVVTHDSEVSCKGFLFFGASRLPVIQLSEDNVKKFVLLWDVFETELHESDNHQQDMLQMLLKRLLILSVRLFKEQSGIDDLDNQQQDVVRDFNFLVEQHFRTKHTVAEYADLMFKSPKTLANLFSRLSEKTPLQVIQDRRMLEARRLLKYTDLPVSDIADDIGFNDIQSFSRFFKRNEAVSPSEYRKN